jgi:hypothetical protein
MVSKRTLTQILFVASLGVSASVAALSPQTAKAGDDDAAPYDCGKADKLAGPAKATYVKACTDAKVTTKKGAADLMKSWKTATVGGAELKLDKCDSCHEKGNGSGAIKAIAYEALPELMKAAGVK